LIGWCLFFCCDAELDDFFFFFYKGYLYYAFIVCRKFGV
jgi:hypothetical protein